MSFGFSVGDFVALGRMAWKLYVRLHDAPDEVKSMNDDVGLLSYLLKSMEATLLRAAELSVDDREKQEELAGSSKKILEEIENLMKKFEGTGGRLGIRDRARWARYKDDVRRIHVALKTNLDALRTLTSTVSLSLGLAVGENQMTIIRILNNIQAELQAGKREGSVLSQALTEIDTGEEVVFDEVVKEVKDKGADADDNKPLINRWLSKGIRQGELTEQSLSDDYVPIEATPLAAPVRVEIISAVYGNWDVTEIMQRFFTTSIRKETQTRSFVVSNTFFGRDPVPGRKFFIMVYRIRYEFEYSICQAIGAAEGSRILIDYFIDLDIQRMKNYTAESLEIVTARWGSANVTSQVNRLYSSPFKANNQFLGSDPNVGRKKFLVIVYTYNYYEFYTKIFIEGDEVYIPPKLRIHAAHWADVDVADVLRARINPQQELHLDSAEALAFPDPWVSVCKTYAVMYQYGDGPLQLLVGSETSGIVEIRPTSPLRRGAYFNPMPASNIIAAAWGQMPMDLKTFGRMADAGVCECYNSWIGFDGLFGWGKTCNVFVRLKDGRIVGVVGREGKRIVLPR